MEMDYNKYWFTSFSYMIDEEIKFGNGFFNTRSEYLKMQNIIDDIVNKIFNSYNIIIINYKEITKEEYEFQTQF